MEEFNFQNTDYWFKMVEFLQQNWAVIESNESGACIVYFFGDTVGVFDQLDFESVADAKDALIRNGFRRYDDDKKAQEFISKPQPPFRKHPHSNEPIYSSGKFWR